VWNAIVDNRPAVVVRPTTVEHVRRAVQVARDSDVELGIRCGGHSAVGHSVPDGGLMLDLGNLAEVTVDPAAMRARVQGGALLGARDRATQRHGLAVTAGNVSHTGVGGLTLGGGYGWLARKYGLACDNVESFEVVTADGALVRASADENPDLFWGLRGGGGNFGVVTNFEFRLHETGTRSLTVEVDFPLDDGVDVMHRWRDLLADAPREATFTADIGPGSVLTTGYVWTGDPSDADFTAGMALVPRVRALGRAPLGERILDRSYLDCSSRPMPYTPTPCAATPRATSSQPYPTTRSRRSYCAAPQTAAPMARCRCRLWGCRPTAAPSATSRTAKPHSVIGARSWSTAPASAGTTPGWTSRTSPVRAARPCRWTRSPAASTSTRS